MSYWRTAARGFCMVTLVSASSRLIATNRLYEAVAVGFFISLLWYSNSSKDRDNRRGAGLAYASGAAVGTFVGFSLAAWLGG